MGFFSSVKKSVSKITKPFGAASVLSRTIDPFNFSGADQSGIFDNAGDLLLGKKGKDIGPDKIANLIRATQVKGIGELNKSLDTPSEPIIREQAARQTKGILSSAQDARRKAQMLMAQRGLGSTSLGLSSDRSITQQAGRDIFQLQAGLPGMIRNQRISDATTRIGAGGLGTPTGINFNTIKGQRSGGLLGIASSLAPLAGTVAGGMK